MSPPARHLVFYDGSCGACHAFVRFVLSRDDRHALDFAPLGGATFASRVDAAVAAGLPDTVVVLTPEGRLLMRARAVARALRELGWPWRVAGAAIDLVPRPIADRAYDLVAVMRRRLFAAPATACPVVAPSLRARLLP